MKNVIILGSTGSIGKNCLDIIRRHRDKFRVIGLSAFGNTDLLNAQIKEFKPRLVSIFDKDKFERLKQNGSCKVLAGEEGLIEISRFRCDVLAMGISGVGAIKPLIASLGRAKKLLLANKEAIISAGSLLTERMKRSSTQVLPVDSEAWAVHNLLKCSVPGDVRAVYITASGGPLFKKNISHKNVGLRQILKHPVWKMGRRITVDSATLMNKGFEVIEVHRLFGIDLDKIKVLIHPQSVIHAFLERNDRSLVSSLFFADMRIPIGSCLGFGKSPLYTQQLDLAKVERLDFFNPDYKKFPLLKLAYYVAQKGKSLPAVLVAADEEAVSLFLRKKIKFFQIPKIIEKVITSSRPQALNGFDDVFYWQRWAKDKVRSASSKLN